MRALTIAAMALVFAYVLSSGWLLALGVAVALWPTSRRTVYVCAAITVAFCLIAPWPGELFASLTLLPFEALAAIYFVALTAMSIRATLIDADAARRIEQARFLTGGRWRTGLGLAAFVFAFLALFRPFPVVGHLALAGSMLVVRHRISHPRNVLAFKWALANGTLALATCALSLAIVEGGARAFISPVLHPNTAYMYDRESIFRFRPNFDGAQRFQLTATESRSVPFHLSSLGLHDVEHGAKKPGEYRIGLLGDSFTMGLTSKLDDTISRQLEGMLADCRPGGSVSVVNLGAAATGPWQQLGLLEERGFDLQPDVIVHQLFLANDVEDTLERTGDHLESFHEAKYEATMRWRTYDRPQFFVDYWLLNHSAAYIAFREAYGAERVHDFWAESVRLFPVYHAEQPPESAPRPAIMEVDLAQWYPKLDAAWARMLDDISATAAECERRGIEYVVYPIPYWHEVMDDTWTRLTENRRDGIVYERGKGRRLLAEELDRRHIAHFSVYQSMHDYPDAAKLFYLHDGHTTPLGNRVIAGAIRDYLVEHGYMRAEAADAAETADQASSRRTAVP